MRQLVTADIGGTHARFAIASLSETGAITLGETIKLRTSDYADFSSAWHAFASKLGASVPKDVAIAIAGPVIGNSVQMTNNTWALHKEQLLNHLELDRLILLNDFAAVAHAVAQTGECSLLPLAGPDAPFPNTGTVSVLGPGTGLGVAHFYRHEHSYHVQPTEGSHIEFGPADAIDDLLVQHFRKEFGRVSVERVISGPGIIAIRDAIASHTMHNALPMTDKEVWEVGLAQSDPLCSAAVDHFCKTLGRIAGDYALAHGASGVVIAGGLGFRIKERLRASDFAQSFVTKGRYRDMVSAIPVKLITHPEPGLYGAVCAFLHAYNGVFTR